MKLFVDYVQPLTAWLQNNPRWSLFITFLISLTESLAIIGSIVPGSVTMTAIGILAGSGIMRIDLTLLAAISGAVAGDSLSYALGYYYSEQLAEIWPFSKYPRWLRYGKEFFETHGGKSVLIGRFVGPLRSITPVIAGIMHMKHWRFLIANVLSALGWSILYVMPGVIIGAASQDLPTESATRLFILILVVLAGIWLLGLFLRWIVKQVNSLLKLYLHDLWILLKKAPFLLRVYAAFTPEEEINHYTTASLALTALIFTFGFIVLILLTVCTQWLIYINLPTHIFIQSFNAKTLSDFFIFCTQLTSTATIASMFLFFCVVFVSQKNLTELIYFCALLICSSVLALSLSTFIPSPRPGGLLVTMPGSSFPAFNLLIATALYGFILSDINTKYSHATNILKTLVFIILCLSGLGSIYLDDYWLTDVLAAYLAGGAVSFFVFLTYRKSNIIQDKKSRSLSLIFPFLIVLLLSASISTYFNYRTLFFNHVHEYKEYSLSLKSWWQQKQPILPIYQLSRVGKKISILNIQFSGDIESFQNYLEENGWESHKDSFFNNLLLNMSDQPNRVKLPLLTQLYENKPPFLIMTYTDAQSKSAFELRIWESNYILSELNKPLWIGSVHQSASTGKPIPNQTNSSQLINPILHLFSTNSPYLIRQINLSPIVIKPTKYPTQPYIMLIKGNDL